MKNLYKQFLIIFTFLISSFGVKAQITGPTSICQNSSANYTCSATATYNWSVSPSGTETISDPSIQNPDISFSAAGNYTITVNTTAPVNTFTLGISADEIPNPPGTLGSISYCVFDSPSPLTATTSSGGTLTWYTTPIGGVGSGIAPVPNTSSSGYSSYYVSETNGVCESIRSQIIVLVNELPLVFIYSNSPICENGTLNLNVSGGNSHAWTGPNGFTSNNQYPTITGATLSTAGVYTVTVTDASGCVNADFTIVNVQPSSDLSGTVFSNSTPITAGQVYLYSGSQGTTIYGLMATTNINASGQYTFTSVPAGDYIIKCIPDSLSYPTLINTYYGDVASWNLADTIHHDCSANSVADINVIEPVLMTGPGVISGYIIEGAGYGQRLINSNNEVQVPGGPLSDIDVNLVSLPSNTIVAQTISDFNGYYEFSNVAVGDYELQVDIPGLPMDSSYFIVITPLMFSANNNQVASSVFLF